MSCWNKIINYLGDNDYKIPHMNKSKMEWEGTLPMVLHVKDSAEPLMDMKMMDAINRNMSKLNGWTLQSSLLMLWMDGNSSQQSNNNC